MNLWFGYDVTMLISDDLALFLNMPTGSIMIPGVVFQEIDNYIIINKLGRNVGPIIDADEKLKALLKSEPGNVSFFNIRRLLRHHLIEHAMPTANVARVAVTYLLPEKECDENDSDDSSEN